MRGSGFAIPTTVESAIAHTGTPWPAPTWQMPNSRSCAPTVPSELLRIATVCPASTSCRSASREPGTCQVYRPNRPRMRDHEDAAHVEDDRVDLLAKLTGHA